jgi:hypothetical protein
MRVLVVMFMLFAGSAYADKSEWNQFVDNNPQKPIAVAPAKTTPAPKPAKVAKAAPAPKAKAPAKAAKSAPRKK